MQKYWEVIRTGVIFKVFRILLDQYNEYTSKLEKITFPSEFIAFETCDRRTKFLWWTYIYKNHSEKDSDL